MLEFETENATVTFDGAVVEIFDRSGDNHRYHARYVKYVKLVTGKKNRQLIELRMLAGAA